MRASSTLQAVPPRGSRSTAMICASTLNPCRGKPRVMMLCVRPPICCREKISSDALCLPPIYPVVLYACSLISCRAN